MSKIKTVYVCQACGSIHNKWNGKCSDCNEWNVLQEEMMEKGEIDAKNEIQENIEFVSLEGDITNYDRLPSNINELDRVLGGGLVKGSVILIGGDPGIGKSTLLLQLVANLANSKVKCAYVSGEESVQQVRLRASRLGLGEASVKLLSNNNVRNIIALAGKEKDIEIMIIDSIQTMFMPDFSSAPGTVTQVRGCTHELVKFAKENDVILILVGHVTKDGQLAGPKVLEHMVDTVLYFEGERGNHFRILRAVKNRFGSVNEIGVFEMVEKGLAEVPNPSMLFLSDSNRKISGSAVFAGIEGTRPILVEIQALAAPSYLPTPRRSVVGWDINRLSMIIAVLNVRYHLNLSDKEIYLNIVGGMKVNDPAADLAAAIALISSHKNVPIPENAVVIGEVGLSGEVRIVSHIEKRLNEAYKLGFRTAIIPFGSKFDKIADDLKIIEIGHIKQLQNLF